MDNHCSGVFMSTKQNLTKLRMIMSKFWKRDKDDDVESIWWNTLNILHNTDSTLGGLQVQPQQCWFMLSWTRLTPNIKYTPFLPVWACTHRHVPVFVCFHKSKVCVSCKRRSRCKQEGADEIFVFQTALTQQIEIVCFKGMTDTVGQKIEKIKLKRSKWKYSQNVLITRILKTL